MTKKRRVRVYKKGGESFKPHMMYNPETGEGTMANIYQDHLEMKNMGYGHEPIMRKGGKPCFECGGGVYEEGGELDMYQKEGEVNAMLNRISQSYPESGNPAAMDILQNYVNTTSFDVNTQEGRDNLSYYPLVGEAADVTSALNYLMQGDIGNALMYSGAAALPFVGGKIVKEGVEAAGKQLKIDFSKAVNTPKKLPNKVKAVKPDLDAWAKHWNINTSGFANKGANLSTLTKEASEHGFDVVPYYDKNKVLQSYRIVDPVTNRNVKFQEGGPLSRELSMYQKPPGEVSYDELKAYHEKMRQAVGTNDIETLNANGLNGKRYSRSNLASTWNELQKLRKAEDFSFWENLYEEASTIFPHVGQQIRGTFNEIAGTHLQEGGPLEQEQEQPMSLYDDKKQQFINILQEEVSEHQEEQTYNSLLEEADMIENMPYQFAREGGQQWMQKASDSMKKRGTVGSFTNYCGGKVTLECIKKGLKSKSKAIRKKAAFAKASWKVAGKMQMGGYIPMHQAPPGQIEPRRIAPISTEANQEFTGDSNASNNQVSDLINRHMNYVKPPQTFTEYLDVMEGDSKNNTYKSKGQHVPYKRRVYGDIGNMDVNAPKPPTNEEKYQNAVMNPDFLNLLSRKSGGDIPKYQSPPGQIDDDNWFDKWNKATNYNVPSWDYTDQNIDLLQPSKPEYEGLDYGIEYENIDANRNSFTSDYIKNYYDDAGDTGGGGDQFSSFNDQESGIEGTPNYNPKLDFNSKEYDADYQSKVSVGTDEGVLSGVGDPNNKSRLRMFGEGLGKKALLNPVAATELFANFTKGNNYNQKRGAGMTDNLVADMQYRGALEKRKSDNYKALGSGKNINTGKQGEYFTGAGSMGQFNASVGQKGMQVGDVQEMSPEQIEEFISMGGQIEFLD